MRAPQQRARPRSKSHPTIGMLSAGRTCTPRAGQGATAGRGAAGAPGGGAGPPAARAAGPGMAIYAAAAGLATAVPVPFVDGVLAGLARGAAMRRTAARRGVR